MKFLTWIQQHQKKILLAAILIYIAIFSAICLWKYSIFGYNTLDLAIFNNVIWNSSEGRLFEMTIHPHSYLGDHAGFGLLALIPFYWLHRGPQILLILQTIALAAAAWPIYLIAKNATFWGQAPKGNIYWQLTPLVVGLAWLLNPLVHNINVFEFHLLPFALVPLLYMLLAYERHQLGRFLLFATIAMLFREDVSLVVAAVGVLAALEKRGYWWRIIPIIFGAAWFLGATSAVARFAPSGSYKFSVFYSWIGDAPASVIPHLFKFGNFEMILGFGLPLLFLPYVSPKRLVLAAGPFLQILLSAPGGNAVVLQTHYSTLFLPGLFLAAIAGIKFLSEPKKLKLRTHKSILYTPAVLGLVLFTSFYGMLSMGPIPNAAARIASGTDRSDASGAWQVVEAVPKDAAVVASYSLVPSLSSREHIYGANYVFLGVQQFDIGPYDLPDEQPIYLAINEKDLQIFCAQFLNSFWAKKYYDGGFQNLNAVAGPILIRTDDCILFGPRYADNAETRSYWEETAEMMNSLPVGNNILDQVGIQVVQ